MAYYIPIPYYTKARYTYDNMTILVTSANWKLASLHRNVCHIYSGGAKGCEAWVSAVALWRSVGPVALRRCDTWTLAKLRRCWHCHTATLLTLWGCNAVVCPARLRHCWRCDVAPYSAHDASHPVNWWLIKHLVFAASHPRPNFLSQNC